MKPLQNLSILLFLLNVFFINALSAQVQADFSVDIQQGCAPLVVNFEDLSLGPVTSYLWDFGDGTISTVANPVHTYTSPGTYTVALQVAGGGTQDSFILSNFIEVSDSLPIVVNDSIRPTTCGGNDGIISLSVTGNNLGTLQYDWSNSTTGLSISGLSPGTYTVTITASNYAGCSWSETYTVGYDDIVLNALTNNPTSCGSADGWINTNPTGGNSPYTFSWSDGSNFQSRSSLEQGVYVLTVEDATGCNKIETFNLLADTSYVSATVLIQNVSCSGENDGKITLSGIGGALPYEYGTTPGFTTQDSIFENLSAGSYTFYVEDASGCIGEVELTVTEPTPIQIYESVQHASCNTCSDGWALVDSVAGGTPPYAYLWSNGETTNSISALLPGVYELTVSDANGCERVQIFTVTVDTSSNNGCGFFVTQNITPESACSTGDGAVEVISSIDPLATYNWSNGSTDNLIDNLNSGFYTVIVTDSNNCSEVFTYFVPTNQIITQIATVNNECNGDADGVVELQTTGDIPPYTYTLLATGDTSLSPNGRFDNLSAGTYTVEVESGSGCISYEDFTISEPAPIQISGIVTNTSCGSCFDGNVDLIVQGGFAPYTFDWSNATFQQDLNGVSQGAYGVTVTDDNGCMASASFFIDDSLSCSDCVWPGDANSDGIADNDDVLAVGIGYGINGSARPNASLNWTAQQAQNWTLALASGANLKHVDCNGDALIDSIDLDAISLNYGLTHSKAEINGDKKVDAHLYYTFADDTVFAGQNVEVQVNYGRDSMPANNVYGIAFSMTIDSSFIEPNSLAFNANNSWMGTNGNNLLDFSKNLFAENKMAAAVTKTDQLNVSGFGQIGILNFTMKDDISGKQLISILNLGFSDVKVIDRNENQKSVFYESSELIVKQVSSGIDYNNLSEIQVLPNPTKGQVYLKNVNGNIDRINIYDLSGSMQLSRRVDVTQSQNYELNISTLPNGIYLLETLGGSGRSINRLVIMN